MGRRAVCLANLRQSGVASSTYANDNKNLLPRRESFTYYIKNRSKLVNYGLLYGKYIGKDLNVFFCPAHMNAGDKVSTYRDYGPAKFANPPFGIIFGGYLYAPPAAEGYSPKNDPKHVYAPGGVHPEVAGGTWNPYMKDWLRTDPDHSARFGGAVGSATSYALYRFPGMPAIMSDQYIGGPVGGWMRNLHQNGFNVMYVDSHAKFVQNKGKPDLTRDASSGPGGAPQLFNVWEYFGRTY